MKGEPEIYCPLCAWRPRSTDRWSCYPGCWTEWNTFWTLGLCPGCAYQWQETQCLRCHGISPHKSWYHYPDGYDDGVNDAEIEEEELEAV